MVTKHFWMIRAGFKNALGLSVEQKEAVAIGWFETGDLSNLNSYEEFLERYRSTYPNDENSRTKIMVRQIYTFAREVAIDDYVLTYVRSSSKYLFGQVQSKYIFDSTMFSEQYPHVRTVRWEKNVYKQSLSSPALRSMGSILTVFQLDKHLEEILALKK